MLVVGPKQQAPLKHVPPSQHSPSAQRGVAQHIAPAAPVWQDCAESVQQPPLHTATPAGQQVLVVGSAQASPAPQQIVPQGALPGEQHRFKSLFPHWSPGTQLNLVRHLYHCVPNVVQALRREGWRCALTGEQLKDQLPATRRGRCRSPGTRFRCGRRRASPSRP